MSCRVIGHTGLLNEKHCCEDSVRAFIPEASVKCGSSPVSSNRFTTECSRASQAPINRDQYAQASRNCRTGVLSVRIATSLHWGWILTLATQTRNSTTSK
eukprot:c2614_g1_i1.p1 GENE.c2614_g1_i1~~c2614_g1_i1.p1  ORF type:complete len:100 (+),score=23.11 c2614_g1_i1:57-356(+)